MFHVKIDGDHCHIIVTGSYNNFLCVIEKMKDDVVFFFMCRLAKMWEELQVEMD